MAITVLPTVPTQGQSISHNKRNHHLINVLDFMVPLGFPDFAAMEKTSCWLGKRKANDHQGSVTQPKKNYPTIASKNDATTIPL